MTWPSACASSRNRNRRSGGSRTTRRTNRGSRICRDACRLWPRSRGLHHMSSKSFLGALLVLAAVAMTFTASPAFADVRVTMHDGRVTVVASDATPRQILTEWARVGQTKIVNVERIPGGPISIELTSVPEAQALDILLRSLSGYITAPRAADAANLSQFDRIIIMPTLASARPAVSSAPPPPVFQQQPQFQQQLQTADDEPDDQRPAPVAVPQANRGP